MSIEMANGKDLELQCVIEEQTAAMLQLRYDAANVSNSDLYLFNRIHSEYTEDGVFKLDDNLVYIYSEDGGIHLSKRIPDIPSGVFAEMPIVPCTMLLRIGERLSETLRLNLPLQPWDPYLPNFRPASVSCWDSLVFSLGYFRASEIGQRPVNYVRTTQGQMLHAYVTPYDQLIVRVVLEGEGASDTAKPPEEPQPCPGCGASNPPGSQFCNQCGVSL
jgi:hypothetical protein